VTVASARPYATLTPFDLLQGLSLRGVTWVHLIPHSTHPQSSSLHGAVKAGSLSEIEKRALPPPCFPSFNFQSTRSRSYARTAATSAHVGLTVHRARSDAYHRMASQPDRLVTQSITTLLLSQGERLLNFDRFHQPCLFTGRASCH